MKFEIDHWYEVNKGQVTWLKMTLEDPIDPSHRLTFNSWDELMSWALENGAMDVEVSFYGTDGIVSVLLTFNESNWWNLGFYFHR